MKDINSGSIRTFEDMTFGASDIVITTHMKPDGDAIGSSVAMYRFLKDNGKSPKIVINDSYPPYLSFLITPEMSDDLIIRTEDPQEADGLILGSDLIICLDFNAFHRTDGLEASLKEANGRKILIDHHLNPSREAFDLSFSETEVSSASELLYHILINTSAAGGDAARLGRKCAEAIMTGMTTDTNNFANSVYPSTLHMASDLLAAGVDREMILNCIYNQYGENRLRLLGHIMKDLLKTTPDGVAYIVLDKETLNRYNVAEGDTEGFVNMPLSIARIRMSILIKEDGDRVRVSIRSKRGTSANMCARRFFNGGGHENAAGGRLYIPDDIKGIEEAGDYIERNTHIFLNNE
ncbi:MAG: bifunctional oligoribonuclease/PAP phosphatase NrnA [Bacteroidales bacterium]|nr:bifunctional oligoribonuclease/PAP phosphatase NrnA [Bacteroidales bacterium]